MYSINFDEKNKIIHATFTGKINNQEPVQYIKTLVTIKSLPENLKILQDFTNADYSIEVSDLDGIAKFAKEYLQKFKTIEIASVHDKSTEIALSLIFSNLLESENLNYQQFNNKDTALKWLVDE